MNDIEFKGTKGNWSTAHGHNCIYIQSNQKQYIAKIEGVNTSPTENKANALLISKAPKLLEMLRQLYANDLLKDREDEVLELLNEATDI